MINRLIRDKFIAGISNSVTQQKLLEAGDIDLEDAIDRAITYEVSVSDSVEVRKNTDQSLSSVNKVSRRFRSKSRFRDNINHGQKSKDNSFSNTAQSSNSSYSCYGCGGPHLRDSCPYSSSTCHKCKKSGHIASVCRSKGRSQSRKRDNSKAYANSVSHESNNDYSYNINCVSHTVLNNSNSKPPVASAPIKANLTINGFRISMEVDSGSACTLISESTYELLNKCYPTPLGDFQGTLREVMKQTLPIKVSTMVSVNYNGREFSLPLVVVRANVPNLLGRNWFSLLKIEVNGVYHTILYSGTMKILDEFSDIFDSKLGCYTGRPIDFQLDPNVRPVFCKPAGYL